MPLIPIFEDCTRERLEKDWDISFPASEWSEIGFYPEEIKKFGEGVEGSGDGEMIYYEANRYDIMYYDPVMHEKISVYLYMDESSTKIYAIDSVVQSKDDDTRYYTKDTPFWDMIESIRTKKNNIKKWM